MDIEQLYAKLLAIYRRLSFLTKRVDEVEAGGGGGGGTVDATIINGSNNAVAGNAVFDALATKVTSNSAITGATKTKITYDSKGLVTAGADATTADIEESADKNYVTDAQLTVIGNTSGTNTGDQDLSGYVPNTRTVNGQALSSNVTLTTSNVTEGSNLYYTDGRSRGALSLTTTGSGGAATYSNATGVLNIPTISAAISQSALTYAANIALDFNHADIVRTLALTGNITFDATTNKAAAKEKVVIITADASTRNLTFPAWTWIGTVAPLTLAANKTMVISLYSTGTTEAGVLATYSVQQ